MTLTPILETRTSHTGSVTWAQAYQQAAADYVPSLTVDATISQIKANLERPRPVWIEADYPAFLVIENSTAII